MLSCKELAKKSLSEEPFSLKERCERWLHLLICKTCRVFMEQINNLNSSLKSGLSQDFEKFEKEKEELKKKLLEEIKNRGS